MEAFSAELAAPAAAQRSAVETGAVRDTRATTLMHLARTVAIPAAVAATVFGLAFSNGTYGVTARDSVAIAIWWLLALCIGTGAMPVSRVPRPALAGGAALAGFAILSGASIAWSDSAERAFDEMNRGLLYLGIFALVACGARRASAARWSDGLAIGIAALGLFALVARLFPHLIPSANASALFPNDPRPSYPINYWNGLAAFVALGLPGLLRVAVCASRPWVRALAIAPFPALVAVIYLTSSRGGTVTAVIAALAFVLLTSRRAAAALALAVGGAGGALAVAVLHGRPHIVNGPLGSSQAASEGRTAAVLILALCVATALGYLLVDRLSRRIDITVPRLSEPLAALVGAAAVVAITVGIVGANPQKRFDSFKQPPQAFTGGNYTSAHLSSGASNGRWQFWEAAVKEFESKPLSGRGAGSYEAYWAKHGSITYYVRDAHSLYLQTLGELGIGGLLLILGLLTAALYATRRRLRATRGAERAVVAAVAAVAIAFSFSLAIDWMWQLTVVGAIGIAAFALLTGPATEFGDERPESRVTARRRGLARGASVAVSFAVIAALAIPLLAQTDVRASQQAAGRQDTHAALKHALDARGWQPWASSTQLQVALAQKDAGQLTAARTSIGKAIDSDPSNWRLYVVSASIEDALGHPAAAQAALRHAKQLSPRSTVLASVR
jgi:O-Antigen ligase